MKKVYIINGPNLNLLGLREPELYGKDSYKGLVALINDHAKKRDYKPVIYQSNHEGDLIDKIHEAYFKGAVGIVINPGAYTHTSIALLDAVKATKMPTVEVHVSDLSKREVYRQQSYIREAVIKTVSGRGILGYIEGIEYILSHESKNL